MPRIAAFLALRADAAKPLRNVDAVCARRGLDERDRALVRRLVGTEVRRRGTLRALVHVFAHPRPKAELALMMRLGIAQLLFMDRVPDHAAVSETVDATARMLGPSKVRVVNAVLREVQRSVEDGHCGDPQRDLVGVEKCLVGAVFRDPAEHRALWAEDALSVPSAMFKRWSKRLGDGEAERVALLGLEEAPLSLRVVGGDRGELRAELAAAGVETVEGTHPAVLLAAAADTGAAVGSEAFRAGRCTVQGEAALRAAEALGAEPGMRVLDLCAAPGGKTAVFAERGAEVVAVDVNPRRLSRVPDGAARLRLSERVAAVCAAGVDGLREDARFDAAFVDAPCSNTGVLAARPGARWRFGPKSLRALTELQAELLRGAARHVRPGGRVVHSVCSIEPEEGAQLVRAVCAEAPLELVGDAQILPRARAEGGPVDGGYHAVLRRT